MSTAKQNWAISFYWIGVAATLACFALVLAGNTDLVSRFEHRGLPVSWMFAGAAVMAFVLAEVRSYAASASVASEEVSGMTPEFEAAEF